ncbi:MAG: IclR family transcriptional regulator [Polaromonas sp.]
MGVKNTLQVSQLFEVFAKEKRALTLSELARQLEMPASSCLNLIRTLEMTGYLYEIGRRQGYYPTGRLLKMAQTISANDPVLDRVKPALQELRDASSETVVLAKFRDEHHVVYLDVLDSPSSIRYTAQPGEVREAYCNSAGRALLSTLAPQELAHALSGMKMKRHTERTLVTPQAVAANLAKTQRMGWFSNIGETLPDLAGVAWPFKLGTEHYAISIAGPLYRIEPNIERLASMLHVACTTIEQKD